MIFSRTAHVNCLIIDVFPLLHRENLSQMSRKSMQQMSCAVECSQQVSCDVRNSDCVMLNDILLPLLARLLASPFTRGLLPLDGQFLSQSYWAVFAGCHASFCNESCEILLYILLCKFWRPLAKIASRSTHKRRTFRWRPALERLWVIRSFHNGH